MSELIPFRDLIIQTIKAVCIALNRNGVDASSCTAIAHAVSSGETVVVGALCRSVRPCFEDNALAWEKLHAELPLAARVCATALRAAELTDLSLAELAQRLEALGEVTLLLNAPDMAYNVFEACFAIGAVAERHALSVAVRLKQLANPKNIEQLAASAWRYATERLRDSISKQGEWLAALDAVEVALTVLVTQPAHRVQLYEELVRVLRRAENTVLSGLIAIVGLQAPEHAIDEGRRKRFAMELLRIWNVPWANGDLPHPPQAINYLASVQAQSMIDDLRLKLSGEIPKIDASLSWHDLTLEHRGLVLAVPLGRALIADPERTGKLALELVHEITHAYCLLGPIGWAHRALHAGVSYLESLMADSSGASGPPVARNLLAVEQWPIALKQLEGSLRSEVLLATWTPWLEGVAIYLELLCDPRDDPNEIHLPFAAVRSLVDYGVPDRVEGESDGDYFSRCGDHMASEFERFYSSVCRRKSRLRHIAYLRSDDLGCIYLTGYLLVRSIVARWERTLGDRIPPVRAAKLLLDATRNGSMPAIPRLDCQVGDFMDQCYESMEAWLSSIAALDRETLSAFFRPVGRTERGHRFEWTSGIPRTLEGDGAVELDQFIGQHDALENHAAQMFFKELQPLDSNDPLAAHYRAFRDLCKVKNILAGMLPVGRDYARLLLSEDERVTVCPRTYAGIVPEADDDKGRLGLPRYSIGSFVLDSWQVADLRRLCGEFDTARVLVTRVIDLAGNGYLPEGHSYVYLGLESAWRRITHGYMGPELSDEMSAVGDLIEARVNATALFGDEATTVASLRFLSDRFEMIDAETELTSICRDFDRTGHAKEVGRQACAKAFGLSDQEVQRCFDSLVPPVLNRMAMHLHRTGWGEHSAADVGDSSLERAAIDLSSPSGILPFGGSP